MASAAAVTQENAQVRNGVKTENVLLRNRSAIVMSAGKNAKKAY